MLAYEIGAGFTSPPSHEAVGTWVLSMSKLLLQQLEMYRMTAWEEIWEDFKMTQFIVECNVKWLKSRKLWLNFWYVDNVSSSLGVEIYDCCFRCYII